MKILAIEKEVAPIPIEVAEVIFKKEATKVWELIKAEIIREIYFTENRQAIIIIEAENTEEANKFLGNLTLVKENYISFELMQLHPYTGFDRLINS